MLMAMESIIHGGNELKYLGVGHNLNGILTIPIEACEKYEWCTREDRFSEHALTIFFIIKFL